VRNVIGHEVKARTGGRQGVRLGDCRRRGDTSRALCAMQTDDITRISNLSRWLRRGLHDGARKEIKEYRPVCPGARTLTNLTK